MTMRASSSRASTVTPCRTSAPAAAACSRRKWSSRRRCVMYASGARARRVKRAPIARDGTRGGRSRPRRPARSRTGAGARRGSVTPPPHGLSRGNVALSTRRTRAPARCEAIRGGRSRRSGSDDGDVVGAHAWRLQSSAPGVCPSGQRERAVNPSAQPTEVRILPPPSSKGQPVRAFRVRERPDSSPAKAGVARPHGEAGRNGTRTPLKVSRVYARCTGAASGRRSETRHPRT